MFKRSFFRAVKDTKSFFGNSPVRGGFVFVILFGLGIYFHSLWAESASEVAEEIMIAISYVFGPTIAFLILLFFWNWVCAPYRTARDELNEFKDKLGLNEPIIRPDTDLAEAIKIVRSNERLNIKSDTEACRYLTDLFATEQAKVWGRESSFTYSEVIMGPKGLRESNRQSAIDNAYSIESRSKSPLFNLREYEHWKNNYIIHEYESVDLLSDGKSGIWLNRYVGL